MPLSAGTRIGPYEIVATLGAGGMGEVYEAIDPRLRRKIALKILPAAMTADPARRERFEREAQTVAALTHPSIVTIYSVEDADGVLLLTMELVDGQSLAAQIPPGGLPLDRLLQIAIPVADAMSFAHARGITHRDLKPANVMVTPDARVKVLDFGLAKLKEDAAAAAVGATALPTQALTGEGHIVGTVAYMAPEQAEGKPVDPRADIFALGVILYEMATGARPFQGDSTASLLSSLLRDTPAPVTDRRPELPRELARVVRRCLEKDPARRLQTALDLRNELEEIKAGAAPSSTPMSAAASTAASPAAPAPSPASDTALLTAMAGRHKSLVATAAVVVVVAGIVLAAWRWWPRGSAGSAPIDSVAVLPFVNASGSPDADYLSDGFTETLTNSLAQIRGLRVVPRTLAAKYKSKTVDPQQAGRDLNVRAVVTGQVVQRGDRLLIQADLIDIVSVAQLWGERFDRSLSDALSMQTEISKSIAEKLRVRLTNEDERSLSAGTKDAAAYQLYLRGRHEYDKRNADGFKRATEYFEQAIGRDPSYALAYAGLANVYSSQAALSYLPVGEVRSKAIAAAQRAVALDERSAGAHQALGLVSLVFEWNWAQAEREFQRALGLDSNSAEAHMFYGTTFLRSVGRFDEGVAEIKQAETLDPLSPAIPANLGSVLTFARRYDEGIGALKRSLQLAPDHSMAHWFLAKTYRLKGMSDLAIAESRRDIELGDPVGRPSLAVSYAVARRRAEALSLLKELTAEARQSQGRAFGLAQAFATLDEPDQAFTWLEQAYREHDANLVWLATDPELDSLHADPRFKDLVRRIGIPTGTQK